jgi:hypothetical protein
MYKNIEMIGIINRSNCFNLMLNFYLIFDTIIILVIRTRHFKGIYA